MSGRSLSRADIVCLYLAGTDLEDTGEPVRESFECED